jgi:hypothetical protein
MSGLPTARELQERAAAAEAQKAAEAAKALAAGNAEKQAMLDRLKAPSGLSDEAVLEKARHIIERAVENGASSVQVLQFPNTLCTDNGRAIDQGETGWEKTLTGLPKELHDFWKRQLEPRGYRLEGHILSRPGGLRGDVGLTLNWS